MGGITDPSFASTCLNEGAGMVAIGGYPIGTEMIGSCYQMIGRGRREFVLPIGEEANKINDLFQLFKKNVDLTSVMVNLRFNDPSYAQSFVKDFSNLMGERPVIEINAHCRQPEVTNCGGGQALLHRKEVLKRIIGVFHAKDFPISLKFRGNAIPSREFIPTVIQLPLEFLHIDSYRIGEAGTDLELLRFYAQSITASLIGNNSIIDRASAEAVLEAGASYFSLARAAEKNPSIFQTLKNI
ncbi:MAG: tRNA-dihydrouridine synthase [Candidatus Heimdallarchaeota archaeon]